MRALTLAAFLLAGCTGGPGATPSPATPAATTESAAPTASPLTTPPSAPPTTRPTAPPTARPVLDSVPTADDKEIAKLIRAGAEAAIPQLKLLNDMDPSRLEDLFLPLDTWITNQMAAIEAYTPSSCTATASTLFVDGMDAYDDIRQTFMDWRDWGAHGHPFSPGAPRLAVAMFEEALAELEVNCPT
jgi:hypothetical protein